MNLFNYRELGIKNFITEFLVNSFVNYLLIKIDFYILLFLLFIFISNETI